MRSEETVTGIEHYKKGKEFLERQDFDNALAEFVKAIKMSPGLTGDTDIIPDWGDCMSYGMKTIQTWFPVVGVEDREFQQCCEAVYTHLKNRNYLDAEKYVRMALNHLPEMNREECHASLRAEYAMAKYGQLYADYERQVNQHLATEKIEIAISAQIHALEIDPDVRLTYIMRPRLSG